MFSEKNKIVIIVSRFNDKITNRLLEGARNHLKCNGVSDEMIDIVWVPGAVEIPLVAKKHAKQNKYDAIICLGAVIRGETGHYDFVCSMVSDGVMRVMLDYDLPVIFGVLTTENSEQAIARSGGCHSDKGAESAAAALEMIKVVQNESIKV